MILEIKEERVILITSPTAIGSVFVNVNVGVKLLFTMMLELVILIVKVLGVSAEMVQYTLLSIALESLSVVRAESCVFMSEVGGLMMLEKLRPNVVLLLTVILDMISVL